MLTGMLLPSAGPQRGYRNPGCGGGDETYERDLRGVGDERVHGGFCAGPAWEFFEGRGQWADDEGDAEEVGQCDCGDGGADCWD